MLCPFESGTSLAIYTIRQPTGFVLSTLKELYSSFRIQFDRTLFRLDSGKINQKYTNPV
jgi:hypothetical protein